MKYTAQNKLKKKLNENLKVDAWKKK